MYQDIAAEGSTKDSGLILFLFRASEKRKIVPYAIGQNEMSRNRDSGTTDVTSLKNAVVRQS